MGGEFHSCSSPRARPCVGAEPAGALPWLNFCRGAKQPKPPGLGSRRNPPMPRGALAPQGNAMGKKKKRQVESFKGHKYVRCSWHCKSQILSQRRRVAAAFPWHFSPQGASRGEDPTEPRQSLSHFWVPRPSFSGVGAPAFGVQGRAAEICFVPLRAFSPVFFTPSPGSLFLSQCRQLLPQSTGISAGRTGKSVPLIFPGLKEMLKKKCKGQNWRSSGNL